MIELLNIAAERLADAERDYVALAAAGMPEDEAEQAAGLAAASDALMDLFNEACVGGNRLAIVTAVAHLAEARLPVAIEHAADCLA